MMMRLTRGLLALLLLPVCVHAAELDRVVAVVNDEVITSSELASRVTQAVQQLSSQGTPAPANSQLRHQVLERMIIEKVQLQYAKTRGISADDAMLDRAIQRIAEQNKLTAAEMPAAVAKAGIEWKQFRDNIRNEIIMARLREREVDSRITVSQAEVDALLTAGAAAPKSREYLVSHILLRAPEGATPDQLKALDLRAEEVMRQIRQGEDFAKLAAEYSAAQDAMQGGSLDWRPLDRLPALFVDEVQGMRKGEVSKITRSAAGLHIFKLVDVRDAVEAKVEVEQTRARHILIRKNESGSNADQAIRRLEDIAARIRNGVDFAEMARVHSSDITAAKGGDLGWLSPGETVPEFERAMNALKPGEVSGVIETPFGWHIIQVLERKKVDVSADRRKMEVRQALRERKSDEAYEDWLRQIRDTAWVEIKPE
ncbi:MAG: SurA domain protein [Proteobacteria bacterium]|nr:SurA domain protein [Pseudomonadota bacterium]